MKPKILITGPTGNTGRPLVDELSARKVSFRVLLHSATKRSGVDRAGVEVVMGDLRDEESIARALDGIERAYLLSPPSKDMFELQAGFVDNAIKAGVRHIVKLSALGASGNAKVGLLRDHARIEDHIARSGIGFTILRPHFFLENLLANIPTVRRDGAIYSPLGEARISPVSVTDIAAVAAVALTGSGHEGRTYTLTGPEAVTYGAIAAALGAELQRTIRYVPVPFEAAHMAMVQMGAPDWLADDLVGLLQDFAGGKGDVVTDDVEKVTGRSPMSVRVFMKLHRDAFAAAA